MDVEDVVVVALHSLDHLAPELAELWSMVRVFISSLISRLLTPRSLSARFSKK